MGMTVAVIGLGGIAEKAYLPILSARQDIELLLCSRNPQAVARYKDQYRIRRGTTHLEELLGWAPQAAFVLTPSSSHREMAEALLSAGVDVYVEKPLTLSLEDSRHLAELADRKRKLLMVGFNRRFAPLHRQARELWGERRIQMAVFQKNRTSAYHPNLYQNHIDDAIHIIDTLRFFCGDGTARHTSYQVEGGKLVGAASTIELKGGGIGLVLTSLQAGGWLETYALHGESTSLIVEAFARLTLLGEDKQTAWEESYASAWQSTLKGRGFVDEIGHFFTCVQSRSQPQTSAWEALKTQELVEAMVAAGKE
jgi:virulence factor